jgi:hypothetical protein
MPSLVRKQLLLRTASSGELADLSRWWQSKAEQIQNNNEARKRALDRSQQSVWNCRWARVP